MRDGVRGRKRAFVLLHGTVGAASRAAAGSGFGRAGDAGSGRF